MQDLDDAALFTQLARLKLGESPYPHQVKALKLLREGRSILLHAPTGSGKSEAAFVPFIALRGNPDFPNRLIYTLPMRALVDSLAKRFSEMAQRSESSMRVVAQHGRRTESVLFYAEAVIATLDQIISSYACAPLSLGVRHGNIPAGAVASSFLVFDEVHTFDPGRGLQSTLIIAKRLRQMGIPFVVMTATLPSRARDMLIEQLGLAPVVVNEIDIPVRHQRQVTLELALDSPLTPDHVMQSVQTFSDRILVVCNTVDRALSLYQSLRGQISGRELMVIHSRFREDDRAVLDRRVHGLLGKDTREPCVVIATQVVEVGLDISCDLLLTELCPIDALIQRAGRCARWAEATGHIKVYGLPEAATVEAMAAPYDADIVWETARALEKANSQRLTWALEQQLVDQVLDERYAKWLEPERAATAAYKLASAAFTGDRKKAEEAVRETDSVEVSLHTQPDSLKGRLRYLPRISVSAGLMRRFTEEHPGSIWSVEVDRNVTGDESRGVEVIERVQGPRDIRFGHLYILSSNVSYSPETGLIFEGPGEDWQPTIPAARVGFPEGRPRLETMEQHLKGALKCFREIVSSREGYALGRVARLIGLPVSEVEKLLGIALICHDLGKASEAWQRAAWETVNRWLEEDRENINLLTEGERRILNGNRDTTLLARFPSLADRSHEPRRPAHATVSAYVMWEFLKGSWGNWGQAAALAMAHHHSVRANNVPRYRLKGGWFEPFSRLLKSEAGVELELSDVALSEQKSETLLPPPKVPPFHQEKVYTLYVIVSRCLSLSDRMAAGGGEHAILSYEEWARNL